MVKTATMAQAWQCNHCAKLFASKSLLKQHQPKHKIKSFKCNQCDHQTSWPVALREHKRTQHTNSAPFRSVSTNTWCKTKAAAKRLEHKTYMSRPARCKVAWCFKSYMNQTELESHAQEEGHGRLNWGHICKCGFTAKNVAQMKKHKMARRHK